MCVGHVQCLTSVEGLEKKAPSHVGKNHPTKTNNCLNEQTNLLSSFSFLYLNASFMCFRLIQKVAAAELFFPAGASAHAVNCQSGLPCTYYLPTMQLLSLDMTTHKQTKNNTIPPITINVFVHKKY